MFAETNVNRRVDGFEEAFATFAAQAFAVAVSLDDGVCNTMYTTSSVCEKDVGALESDTSI